MAPERPDPIPRALRRYATIVTWLFILVVGALLALILLVVFTR